jgi:hypothetical protein
LPARCIAEVSAIDRQTMCDQVQLRPKQNTRGAY